MQLRTRHRPETTRRTGRAGAILACVAALSAVSGAVASPAPASAHAQLVSTLPASGDRLEEPPEEIVLGFTEAVELPEVTLLDSTGETVAIGEPSQPVASTVAVAIPDTLPVGGYVVSWSAVSADGHPISGAYGFAVGDATPPDPGAVELDSGGGAWSSVLSLARALQYAGIALSLGLWGFVVISWWAGRGRAGVTNVVTIGALLVALGSALRIVAQAGNVGGSVGDVMSTDAGRAWASLAILAVPLGLLASSLTRLLRRWLHGVLLAVLAILVGRAVAVGGHGGAGDSALAGTVFTIVHVAAAALWLGGLAGALLALRGREDDETAEPAIRRFSEVALGAVTLLAVTGTAQAYRQLDSWDALTGSPFGRALIVKLCLVGLLLAVAALSRFTLRSGTLVVQRPGRPERRWHWADVLRRSVAFELVLAGLVIGATGTLAGASPLVSDTGTPVNLAMIVDDRTAYVSVFPAVTGTNSIHVTIDDVSIGGPDEITVSIEPADGRTPPIEVPVVDAGPGHVIADAAEIPFPGAWVVVVDARYGEFELVTFRGEFDVG